MRLSGRHALVTGGGTGIGLAISAALARAGAEVTITGRDAARLERQAAGDARLFAQVMDVTDEASVRRGFAAATNARGPVAIHVANAGIAEGRSITRTDLDFWRRTMATNLDGAFLTIREALGTMGPLGWGRVIAISSVAGLRGLRGAPAYTASKHGLVGLIRGLAADYVDRGITFNAICPGYVDTEIVTRNVAAISRRAGLSEDAALQAMLDANAHKRLISVEEVAGCAVWLCDPDSASVNGQSIGISGGQA